LEESKTYHEKRAQRKPIDPEPYDWIGVIDWTLAYHTKRDLIAESDQSPHEKRPITKELRLDLAGKFRGECRGLVDDGIDKLQKAMDRRPDYADAIAYLSLLDRLKADMESNSNDRVEYSRLADSFVDQAKAIKNPQQALQRPLPNDPPK
jgi:hypothetical protein